MDNKEVITAAQDQGFVVEKTKSGHYKATKNGSTIYMGGTISDWRGVRNNISMLRKIGFTWPPNKQKGLHHMATTQKATDVVHTYLVQNEIPKEGLRVWQIARDTDLESTAVADALESLRQKHLVERTENEMGTSSWSLHHRVEKEREPQPDKGTLMQQRILDYVGIHPRRTASEISAALMRQYPDYSHLNPASIGAKVSELRKDHLVEAVEGKRTIKTAHNGTRDATVFLIDLPERVNNPVPMKQYQPRKRTKIDAAPHVEPEPSPWRRSTAQAEQPAEDTSEAAQALSDAYTPRPSQLVKGFWGHCADALESLAQAVRTKE